MPFDFDDEDNHPAEQFDGPLLSVAARILLADFTATSGPHRFGGPLALEVRGDAPTPPALHRVLTLSLADPTLGLSIPGLSEFPLVYGFVFDGCKLTYRVNRDGEIQILEMSPRKPSPDWPYPNYPAAFSARRFALRADSQIEPDQVHELTWQDLAHIDPAHGVVAIVPPSPAYGLSLWGPSGDRERVQVIFEIDPATRTVVATNQCT
jgi:hypothetical protein